MSDPTDSNLTGDASQPEGAGPQAGYVDPYFGYVNVPNQQHSDYEPAFAQSAAPVLPNSLIDPVLLALSHPSSYTNSANMDTTSMDVADLEPHRGMSTNGLHFSSTDLPHAPTGDVQYAYQPYQPYQPYPPYQHYQPYQVASPPREHGDLEVAQGETEQPEHEDSEEDRTRRPRPEEMVLMSDEDTDDESEQEEDSEGEIGENGQRVHRPEDMKPNRPRNGYGQNPDEDLEVRQAEISNRHMLNRPQHPLGYNLTTAAINQMLGRAADHTNEHPQTGNTQWVDRYGNPPTVNPQWIQLDLSRLPPERRNLVLGFIADANRVPNRSAMPQQPAGHAPAAAAVEPTLLQEREHHRKDHKSKLQWRCTRDAAGIAAHFTKADILLPLCRDNVDAARINACRTNLERANLWIQWRDQHHPLPTGAANDAGADIEDGTVGHNHQASAANYPPPVAYYLPPPGNFQQPPGNYQTPYVGDSASALGYGAFAADNMTAASGAHQGVPISMAAFVAQQQQQQQQQSAARNNGSAIPTGNSHLVNPNNQASNTTNPAGVATTMGNSTAGTATSNTTTRTRGKRPNNTAPQAAANTAPQAAGNTAPQAAGNIAPQATGNTGNQTATVTPANPVAAYWANITAPTTRDAARRAHAANTANINIATGLNLNGSPAMNPDGTQRAPLLKKQAKPLSIDMHGCSVFTIKTKYGVPMSKQLLKDWNFYRAEMDRWKHPQLIELWMERGKWLDAEDSESDGDDEVPAEEEGATDPDAESDRPVNNGGPSSRVGNRNHNEVRYTEEFEDDDSEDETFHLTPRKKQKRPSPSHEDDSNEGASSSGKRKRDEVEKGKGTKESSQQPPRKVSKTSSGPRKGIRDQTLEDLVDEDTSDSERDNQNSQPPPPSRKKLKPSSRSKHPPRKSPSEDESNSGSKTPKPAPPSKQPQRGKNASVAKGKKSRSQGIDSQPTERSSVTQKRPREDRSHENVDDEDEPELAPKRRKVSQPSSPQKKTQPSSRFPKRPSR
ncbi:hypothetical protein N0V90_003624 [Kalmusia sp. IMI 367209]|nr:hypothetical protein N0V90_003624 [Kalmusia sp. IMI 367209]